MNPSSPRINGASDNQPAFELDDGTGLRVVRANFEGESKFSWDLFEGYDSMRVLTYSSSTSAMPAFSKRFIPAAPTLES